MSPLALRLNAKKPSKIYYACTHVRTLTDTKLSDIGSLRRALSILHEKHRVPHVVMSSMPLHEFFCSALPSDLLPADVRDGEFNSTVKSHLICISSSYNHQSERFRVQTGSSTTIHSADGTSTVYAHVLPCVPGYYSGVGDLFSALLLAHYHEETRGDNSACCVDLAPNARVSKFQLLPQIRDHYS